MILTVKNQKLKIGGKMFPVAQKSKMQMFTHLNTEPFDMSDPKIKAFAEEVDKHIYETGHCYTNANFICNIAKKHGLNAQFYAGWVVLKTNFPIHHAWVVVDGKHIIDTAYNKAELDLMLNVDYSNPNWRKILAPKLKALEAMKLPTSEYCAFGKAFDVNGYVGSPDEYENAKRIFRKLTIDYPEHISYAHKGMNPFGRSRLQEEMDKY